MRGLVPAHIMAAIESRTGLHMADMVDLFAGPSTGSILNAALTRPHRRKEGVPQYKARHMIRFYEREGASIFPQDRFRELRGLLHDFNNRTMKLSTLGRLVRHGHYNERHLANALYALYGDAKLGDSLSSLIISCYSLGGEGLKVTGEDEDGQMTTAPIENNIIIKGGSSLWLKHLCGNAYNPNHLKPMEVTLYDAVMASTAAPTYFPCHDFSAFDENIGHWRTVHGIDGSIFDNPAIAWHGAIKPHVPPDMQPVMICLGTGITNKAIHKDQWNRYGALGVVDPANDLPLINIFFHAPESALMEAFKGELGDDLYIFNRSLFHETEGLELPSNQIDDAGEENLARLAKFANIIIEENSRTLDDLCHMLVTNRDRKLGLKQDFLSSLKRTVYAFSGIKEKPEGVKAPTPNVAPNSTSNLGPQMEPESGHVLAREQEDEDA